jgi:hypothetical protein
MDKVALRRRFVMEKLLCELIELSDTELDAVAGGAASAIAVATGNTQAEGSASLPGGTAQTPNTKTANQGAAALAL